MKTLEVIMQTSTRPGEEGTRTSRDIEGLKVVVVVVLSRVQIFDKISECLSGDYLTTANISCVFHTFLAPS